MHECEGCSHMFYDDGITWSEALGGWYCNDCLTTALAEFLEEEE